MTSKEKLIADLKNKLESAQSDLEELCVRKTALLTCMKALRSNLAPEEGLLYVPGFSKQPCVEFEYTIKKNLGTEFRRFFHLQQRINQRICDLNTEIQAIELVEESSHVDKVLKSFETKIACKNGTLVVVLIKSVQIGHKFVWKGDVFSDCGMINYNDFLYLYNAMPPFNDEKIAKFKQQQRKKMMRLADQGK